MMYTTCVLIFKQFHNILIASGVGEVLRTNSPLSNKSSYLWLWYYHYSSLKCIINIKPPLPQSAPLTFPRHATVNSYTINVYFLPFHHTGRVVIVGKSIRWKSHIIIMYCKSTITSKAAIDMAILVVHRDLSSKNQVTSSAQP